MVSYRYTADDPQGRRVDGHVDAASVEDARRRLEEQGYRVLEVMEIQPTPDETPPEGRLSSDEAQELAENVARLSEAGLPLSAGLRAAGDETDSSRLARAFYYLADQLDQGRPLEDVLESSKEFLPAHVSGLIRAAAKTSHVGPALAELVEHYRDTSMLRQGIWRGLSYPLLVAGFAAVVLSFVIAVPGGEFEGIFEDFDVELPMLSQAFFYWRRAAVWALPLLVGVLLALAIAIRWRLDAGSRHRWLASTPIVGPMWHWLGLLEWIGLVRVLIRHGVTLLEALRLAADGVSNGNVARLSLALAEGVARGRSLSYMIALEHQIPASLAPLVRWGEEAGGLAESLGLGGEMLEERVRTRALWLHTALPPLLFIAIGSSILMVLGALWLPLISLISCLS